MNESNTGFGNEPLEPAYTNGNVIEGGDTSEYTSQDEHFAAVDRLSDLGVANYADAAERLAYDAAEYELDELFNQPESKPVTQATPGVSVSLAERAYAVGQLMDGISAQNKLSGATRSGALSQRYHNSREVLDGMEQKAARYRHDEARAVEMLAKTAALRAIGFNEAEVAASQAGINRNLSRLRGTGKEAVRLRNKQKTVTSRTARKVTGR